MSTNVSDKQPVWQKLFTSQVGKKLLTGITGLGLTLFVLGHMAGNLSYFAGHEAYNAYAHKLMSLGPLFYFIELGLLAFFVFHIVLGINIYLGKRAARKQGYKRYKSVGGASRQSLSSRSMIITGITLAVFLVFHLLSFKYGEYIDSATQFDADGKPYRDLAKLVEKKFESPLYAFGYTGMMLLLALHLRHGVWSAFQSLGATNPRLTPLIYSLGALLGILIAVGFIVLPLWIFFN